MSLSYAILNNRLFADLSTLGRLESRSASDIALCPRRSHRWGMGRSGTAFAGTWRSAPTRSKWVICPNGSRLRHHPGNWRRCRNDFFVDAGKFRIALDTGVINFLPTGNPEAALTGIELQVVNRDRVLRRAKARGCMAPDGAVDVCGIRFRLT